MELSRAEKDIIYLQQCIDGHNESITKLKAANKLLRDQLHLGNRRGALGIFNAVRRLLNDLCGDEKGE